MDFLKTAIDFVVHFDQHLGTIIAQSGAWTYLLLFGIVFCETGLVVTPFYPAIRSSSSPGRLPASSPGWTWGPCWRSFPPPRSLATR